MKTLMTLIVLFNFSTASAKNTEALKLENLHLKIAKTLGESHVKNGPCGGEIEAYTIHIVEAVERARYYFDHNFAYNKVNQRKFKIDPSVTKSLESTLFLKSVMNMFDFQDLSTLEHSLNRVIMWGPAPGAYGNMTYLKFGPNNTVEYWELELFDEEPWYEWKKTDAIFYTRKKDYEYVIDIDYGHKLESFILKRDYGYENFMWYMVPEQDSSSNPYQNGFVDYPSECEA